MSSPIRDGSPNGHPSPGSASNIQQSVSRRLSDSELSDIQVAGAPLAASPSPDPEDSNEYVNGGHDFAESSSSTDENNASDDGDFDMEDEVDDDQATAQSDGTGDARSSSNGSSRPAKRKATVDEDEYIKANPELYGLRRSV